MSTKSKVIIFGVVIGAIVLAILLNYISSEVYSLKYWNPIRKVYFKNTFVKAEAVDTAEKIEQGLAGRKELSEGRGMLFVMPSDDWQRFWMKGMQFPIDIIWLERGRVVGCEKNISPNDERIFTSPSKSSLVLEIPEGFCDHYNVQINDPVGIQ
ncbi:MAG: DUF192 domain-containing protein [Patescibacteria group bacterium]|nr:DUF192 domain-containing protein [Patescibacteria group bacterium]